MLAVFWDRSLFARRADTDAGTFGIGGQTFDSVDGQIVSDRAPGFGVSDELRADCHLKEAASATGQDEAFGLPETPAAGIVMGACVDQTAKAGGQTAAVDGVSGEPAVGGDRVDSASVALD